MTGNGRISVLVSKELQTLLSAIRELEPEVRARLRRHTREVIEPVWKEAVLGHVVNRMQTRVLGDTARASVSDSQVLLKSGHIGKMQNGLPKSQIAKAVEFGADRRFKKTLTSKNGVTYQRRTKAQFNLPRSRGYVVYPAARLVIPRAARLWIQTTLRTTHETLEKGGARNG